MRALRSHLAILVVFVRASIQNELAYRVNLVVNVGLALVGLGNAVAGVAVVFSHTQTLRGWTFDQTLVLLGVYTIVNGLLNVFVAPNLDQLGQSIRQGTLDFTLLKPASSQFLASFQRCIIWGMTDVVLGIGLVIYSLSQLSGKGGLDAGSLALFAVTMTAGVTVIYCLWIMFATFAFWFVRIDNMTTILHSLFGMGRFAVDAYPLWLRRVLTYVVPVALVTTVPAEALSGRLSVLVAVASVLVAAAMLWLSTRLWRLGLGQYTSASS
jgi:viologen exporter family transport system permease protein